MPVTTPTTAEEVARRASLAGQWRFVRPGEEATSSRVWWFIDGRRFVSGPLGPTSLARTYLVPADDEARVFTALAKRAGW